MALTPTRLNFGYIFVALDPDGHEFVCVQQIQMELRSCEFLYFQQVGLLSKIYSN